MEKPYRTITVPGKDTEEPAGFPCEVCGAMMYRYIHGDSCGCICHNCGNGWARSCSDPIVDDETEYTLRLDTIPEPTADNIRVAARLAKCSYAEAKARLQSGDLAVTNLAMETADTAKVLQKAGYLFAITPDFPYEY